MYVDLRGNKSILVPPEIKDEYGKVLMNGTLLPPPLPFSSARPPRSAGYPATGGEDDGDAARRLAGLGRQRVPRRAAPRAVVFFRGPVEVGLRRASRGAVPRLLLHRERERGVELGLLRAFGSHALGFRDLRCASCGAESFAMAEMTERTEI